MVDCNQNMSRAKNAVVTNLKNPKAVAQTNRGDSYELGEYRERGAKISMQELNLKYISPYSLMKIGCIDDETFKRKFFDKSGQLVNLNRIAYLITENAVHIKEFFSIAKFEKKIKVYELFCRQLLHRWIFDKYFVHPLIFQEIFYFLNVNDLSLTFVNTTCNPCCPNITKPYCDWCS